MEEEGAFALRVASFHEALVESRLDDSFADLLTLANVAQRLAAGGSASSHLEMVEDCLRKLRKAVLEALEALLESRQGIHSEPASAMSSSLANCDGKGTRTPPRSTTSTKKSTKSRPGSSSSRDKLAEHNRRFHLRAQRENEARKKREEALALERKRREEEDIPRLQKAAGLCRLAESLRLIILKGKSDAAQENDSFAQEALRIYSKLVCAGLSERYNLILDELEAHQDLTARTNRSTGVDGQVESSDDDPFLKSLSYVLLHADSLIEKLMMGDYAVASSEGDEKLATSAIVREVEARTSGIVIAILDAFIEDRKIAQWREKSSALESEGLDEEQVTELDNLLNDMMEAQRYCGHFIKFLLSLEILNAKEIDEGSIREKQLYLASDYVILEKLWLNQSLKKAKAIAEIMGESNERVNSIVEHTFYVVRKSFARALHTENSQSSAALANHLAHSLQDDYSETAKELLKGKIRMKKEMPKADEAGFLERRQSSDNADEMFAALLDSDLHGTLNIDSLQLVSINTIELSAIFMNDLISEIRHQMQERFPQDMVPIEMALQGLQEVADEHQGLRDRALQEIVELSLSPGLSKAVQNYMASFTYNLDHIRYEEYERNDPFVYRFISKDIMQNRIYTKCKQYLSPSNQMSLVILFSKQVAKIWEESLLKTQMFNSLGALRFNEDLRNMITCLADLLREVIESADEMEQFRGEIRSAFARLFHMSFILSLEKEMEISYSLPPALDAEEVKRVVERRLYDS